MWHKTVGKSLHQCCLPWLYTVLLVGNCIEATPRAKGVSQTGTTRSTPTTVGEVIGATSLAAAASAAAAYAAKAATETAATAAATHKHNQATDNEPNRSQLNDLKQMRSANLLLEDLQQANGQLINLTRHHDGDIFRTTGITTCNADTCIGLSSGTAALVRDRNDASPQTAATATLAGGSGQLELLTRRLKLRQQATAQQQQLGETCSCRCLPYLRAYREDLGICVDDIHECTLSPFVSGSSSEKIPFVFLPLRGQIIYPSREISFANIHTPVCAVTGAQYLTSNGWSDLRNPIDTDYPFRMFRDEGRSFLQWLGETELRQKMQGRLIVVHLVCRDMNVALNVNHTDQLMPPKNVHSPCVAFRVNGSPVKYTHNVPEVFFQPANSTTLAATSDGMTMREYLVIGICSLLLGLIYVASVFLYLYMKKRKNRGRHSSRNSLDNLANEINYPKNDQVTYGVPFSRVGSIYSSNSLGNEPNTRSGIGSLKEDMGIVKNNPLLQHFPQLSEREHNSGFASDISNSNSECEMEDKIKTSVLVHPQLNMSTKSPKVSNVSEQTSLETDDFLQENECLPLENVAVIEDLLSEEKLENLRAMVNGNVRKKLYFNPAYFEPHLLAEPPQAAVEFLQKIREVIAIAKYKMAAKRYQPSLNIIPEEATTEGSTGSKFNVPLQQNLHDKNVGDKRNSIEQWLQGVPNTETDQSQAQTQTQTQTQTPAQKTLDRPTGAASPKRSNGSSNGASSMRKDISAPKERPPPPPMSRPKQEEQMNRAAEQQSNLGRRNFGQPPASKSPSATQSKSLVGNNYESYSAFSAAAHVYGFAGAGSELYNNPKFMLLDSPAPSLRSHASSNHSKSSRKRNDALDQFAATSTPTSLNSFDRQHYNMLRNMRPEIIYDSLKREYAAQIPTPDYDSTMEKKIKEIYSSTQSSIPSVPTPDYSSLSRKSLKQFQPDSPIYRRKSPQYLIVDYETDSLERLEPVKRKGSHSSSSPSSDVSSQLSPSLSTALPLEEELEISHTVYDRLNGFRKEGELKKRVATKNGHVAHKPKEVAARIKYDTPFRGSMTIEVEHEPPSDLERTDSDQFEPDTLDRKPRKQSFCDINAWDQHSRKTINEQFVGSEYNQINSLPDLSRQMSPTPQAAEKPRTASFILKSSSSFRHLRELYESPLVAQANSKCEEPPREVTDVEKKQNDEGRLLALEAKHTRRQRGLQNSPTFSTAEVGSIKVNKTTIKISSQEEPQRKPSFSTADTAKYSPTGKVNGPAVSRPASNRSTPTPQRSNQHYCVPLVQNKRPLPPPPPAPPTKVASIERQSHYQNERSYQLSDGKPNSQDEDSFSMHSEVTQVTGISDTLVNSEFENSCNNTLSSGISSAKNRNKPEPMDSQQKQIDSSAMEKMPSAVHSDYDVLYNKKINSLRNDYSLTKYLNRRKSQRRENANADSPKDATDADINTSNNNAKNMKDVDLNQFDGLSVSSLSNRSSSHLSERTKEMYRNAGVPVGIAYPQRAASNPSSNTTSVQTVYRCEIEPSQLTAGMQIAIGLKDRAKKAKDLKNAWRKFVTMAASKFSPSQSPAPTYGNKSAAGFLEAFERDEGISSIIEDASATGVTQNGFGATACQNYYEQRFGARTGELDSGYMSTDSTELYKRNVYDRYNFKMMAGRGHIIRVDTIEDNSEGGIEEDAAHDMELDASRFDDLEHMVSPGSRTVPNAGGDLSDAESDKTLTRSHSLANGLNVHGSSATMSSYSSEDEQGRGHSTCCGSSETDEETNAEDMWESGAESIETHSVLYKMIRKT